MTLFFLSVAARAIVYSGPPQRFTLHIGRTISHPKRLLDRLVVQPIQLYYNNCNCVKLNSGAVPSYHVARDVLHAIRVRCAARNLHTIAPGPLDSVLSVRV